MYDIIGDIHGHADELVELLTTLGYSEETSCFRHPSRKAVFCGDFIDRGPQIRDVLTIVRHMTEDQAALSVIGNHEFNALAYHTARPTAQNHSAPITTDALNPGNTPNTFTASTGDSASTVPVVPDYFRPHNSRNVRQHAATTEQVPKEDLAVSLEWFRSLPIALDLGPLRVVHACWHPQMIAVVNSAIDSLGPFTADFLEQATVPGNKIFDAVEIVLKGPEAGLPEGVTVSDKDGHLRRRVRIRWFDKPDGASLGEYSLPKQSLPQTIGIPGNVEAEPYPADAVPVFIGHYWLPSAIPSPLKPNVACLDYSVARGGLLCAYRFDGERTLSADRFVTVPSRAIALPSQTDSAAKHSV
ncbi:MAG: metallophosphoesterase [Planctomycetaceae bacterium]|nr:metallophosphoesterase [Planctomycetaceae bacterium]